MLFIDSMYSVVTNILDVTRHANITFGKIFMVFFCNLKIFFIEKN